MTFTQLAVSYVATALLVGLGGGLLAADRRRSMQVRTAATWTAMMCLVWPLTLVAFAVIAVAELRRQGDRETASPRATAPAGVSFRAG